MTAGAASNIFQLTVGARVRQLYPDNPTYVVMDDTLDSSMSAPSLLRNGPGNKFPGSPFLLRLCATPRRHILRWWNVAVKTVGIAVQATFLPFAKAR